MMFLLRNKSEWAGRNMGRPLFLTEMNREVFFSPGIFREKDFWVSYLLLPKALVLSYSMIFDKFEELSLIKCRSSSRRDKIQKVSQSVQ